MRTFRFAHPIETVTIRGKRYHRSKEARTVYPDQSTKEWATEAAKIVSRHGDVEAKVVPFVLTGSPSGKPKKVWLVYERRTIDTRIVNGRKYRLAKTFDSRQYAEDWADACRTHRIPGHASLHVRVMRVGSSGWGVFLGREKEEKRRKR